MRLTFPYHKLPALPEADFFGRWLLRPVIPIALTYHDTSLRYAALVDSGADFCVFHAEIGEALGIDVASGQRIVFSGAQVSAQRAIAYFHPVRIAIGDREYATVVSFSRDIALGGYGVLGQRGFFDVFVVKLDLKRERVELESSSKNGRGIKR